MKILWYESLFLGVAELVTGVIAIILAFTPWNRHRPNLDYRVIAWYSKRAMERRKRNEAQFS